MNTDYGSIKNEDVHSYLVRLHKRVFKILPMFEENCGTIDDYIGSITREILGNSKLFLGDELLTIVGTLNGLSLNNHKSLRSDILKACGILAEMQERVRKNGFK